MDININGSVLPCRSLLPHVKQHRYGKIVQLSGGGATNPLPRITAYAASKAYVLSLSEALSEELKGTNVTVTALCPGLTDTGMVHGTDLAKMLPGLMMMDAKSVAREGYSACASGKAVHVAGSVNELAVTWVKYQPSWLVRAVGGLLARGSRGMPT